MMKRKMKRKMKGKIFKALALALSFAMIVSVVSPSAMAANFSSDSTEEEGWGLSGDSLQAMEENSDADFDGYIVKLKDNLPKREIMSLQETAEAMDDAEPIAYADNLYVVDDLEAAQDLTAAEDVEYIEPNYLVELFDSDMKGVVNDVKGTENDDHLAMMDVPAAWEYGLSGEDMDIRTDMGADGNPSDQIVIAVVDSGLDPDHEDIDYRYVLPGANLVSTAVTATTEDTLGHGTFVSGQILAQRDNQKGINGIADNTYIMPLKVFVSRTTATSTIISAINYGTQQKLQFDKTNGKEGANICVMNMSLGGESPSTAMKEACETAIDAGIIVVTAAGNDEDSRASYPAQYAIGVGSVDTDGNRSYYSQILSSSNGEGWQNKVWVTAPGSDYTSLWYTGEYYTGSGTSFSSPEVAALAAIAVSLQNDLTVYYESEGVTTNHEAFKRLLKDTAVYKSGGKDLDGQDIYFGWGLVNFRNVIEKLSSVKEDFGKPSEVAFEVMNGAGTLLDTDKNNLKIDVFEYDTEGVLSSTVITPDTDGHYNLKIGTKYKYVIAADKYNSLAKDFTPITDNRLISVALEGMDYHTNIVVKDTDGKVIPGAAIQVIKDNGAAVSQEAADDSFLTKNGHYSYTVSAPGYFPADGEFTIDDENNEYENNCWSFEVVLKSAADICSVKFEVDGADPNTPANAEPTIYDSAGDALKPYSDGAWKLEPGSYTYTILSDDYQEISGSIALTENDKGTEMVIKKTMNDRLYWTFFDIIPITVIDDDSTVIEVKDSNGKLIEPFYGVAGEYRVINGTYNYKIAAEGYKTYTGSFTMAGKLQYIDIQLEEGSDSTPGSGGSFGSGGNGGSGNGGTDLPNTNADDNNTVGNGGKYDIPIVYHDFEDIAANSWYRDAVNYVVTLGIFNGIDAKSFAPEMSMTRGMLATVLYRLAGDSAAEGTMVFSDVAAGAYYYDAVIWANQNGIVNGTSAYTFEPDSPVSREQAISMIYRYAKWTDADTKVSNDAAALMFGDYNSISVYAQTAVGWAFEKSILTGDGNGRMNPQSDVSRAEVSAMLMRFAQKLL